MTREEAQKISREKSQQIKREAKEKPLIVKHVMDKLTKAIADFDNSREGFEEYDAIAEKFKELDILGESNSQASD